LVGTKVLFHGLDGGTMVGADPHSERAQAATVVSENVVGLAAEIPDIDGPLYLWNGEPVSKKRLEVVPIGIEEPRLRSSADWAPRHSLIHGFHDVIREGDSVAGCVA
jgi:hypothetical protein